MRFKRRRKPGPAKNVEKVQRRENKGHPTAGGPALKEIYPEVSSLEIEFSITSPQNDVVKEETRTFAPGDPTDFSCGCPGTCGVGSFDLSEKVDIMVEAQEPQSDASGTCELERFGGIPTPCGYVMKCRIKIGY